MDIVESRKRIGASHITAADLLEKYLNRFDGHSLHHGVNGYMLLELTHSGHELSLSLDMPVDTVLHDLLGKLAEHLRQRGDRLLASAYKLQAEQEAT